MTQWEYKTVELEMKNGGIWSGIDFPHEERLETTLNKMGILGWELINTVTTDVPSSMTAKMLFIFKRQK